MALNNPWLVVRPSSTQPYIQWLVVVVVVVVVVGGGDYNSSVKENFIIQNTCYNMPFFIHIQIQMLSQQLSNANPRCPFY